MLVLHTARKKTASKSSKDSCYLKKKMFSGQDSRYQGIVLIYIACVLLLCVVLVSDTPDIHVGHLHFFEHFSDISLTFLDHVHTF